MGESTKKSGSSETSTTKSQLTHPTLKAISVAGYKSLSNKQRIEIRPLTILAGANSGGKSSIIQPVLLLKQTIDSPYDPGSLLLGGANVHLTSAKQLLSKKPGSQVKEFTVELEFGSSKVELCFRQVPKGKRLDIYRNTVSEEEREITITPEMDLALLKQNLGNYPTHHWPQNLIENGELEVVRDRSFLNVVISLQERFGGIKLPIVTPGIGLVKMLGELIHVPGLRGNPERDYKTTAVGDSFPGTFEVYVASVIKYWQSSKDPKFAQLGEDLEGLGLTWKVEAKQRDETQVELKVGRLPHSSRGGAQDLVSIADVGFGISQTLPVLVALLVAKPSQIVYIEQPEIHLHPRAQREFSKLLANAAKRGVIVVIETHSTLLLQGVQTLVAQNVLPPDLVKLHWFKRDDKGATTVSSADLDDTGAFGDWPEDFDEVELTSDNDYLSAAQEKLFLKNKQS